MMARVIYVAILAIWVASLLAGRHAAGFAYASPNAATSAGITAPQVPRPGGVSGTRPDGSADDSTAADLVGNDVEHAIADYRIDVGGSVYERHSPETAVERLASPSS